MTKDTDDGISNWLDLMNDIATKLDDNNNSSLTSDAFACTTCPSKKWNPSFGLALVGNITFIELIILSHENDENYFNSHASKKLTPTIPAGSVEPTV